MFRKDAELLEDILHGLIREQGLETPLLEKRLIDAWPDVVGRLLASYTENLYIRNQILYVHVKSPALRSDLTMARSQLVKKLNAAVGNANIISDIKFQ